MELIPMQEVRFLKDFFGAVGVRFCNVALLPGISKADRSAFTYRNTV
jgi:hypothetical protein